MRKRQLYVLGLITLLIFPLPTFIGLWFMEGIHPLEIFQFERIEVFEVGMGIMLGFVYSFIALAFMQARVFEGMPIRVENMIRDMRLTFWDSLFLSICAGVGEELLFRSGVQFYLGPLITSIFFVAIHGYLNPMNWRMSLYGLIVLPFIFMISWGFETFGLWFAIVAHTTYDLMLFLSISKERS